MTQTVSECCLQFEPETLSKTKIEIDFVSAILFGTLSGCLKESTLETRTASECSWRFGTANASKTTFGSGMGSANRRI